MKKIMQVSTELGLILSPDIAIVLAGFLMGHLFTGIVCWLAGRAAAHAANILDNKL